MIIDLHIHTTISGDSTITPELLIHEAKNAGLDGVCITEHGIERSKIAQDLSIMYNFPVFGGMEASTELGDILVFGIERYPRVISKAIDLKDYVKENGGVLIAAHPFRSNFNRSPFSRKLDIETACKAQLLQLVDAMETINGWSTEEEVIFCTEVSKRLCIQSTGGSDAHVPWQVGCCITNFENRILNEYELVEELKRGKFYAEDRRLPNQKDPNNWFS